MKLHRGSAICLGAIMLAFSSLACGGSTTPATARPTVTAVVVATNSSLPSATITRLPPTATATPVPTATLAPTATPTMPATATSLPTSTPLPTPSATTRPTSAATPTRAAPSATVQKVDAGFTCNQCIKGNINDGGVKIYHLPSCPDYGRTVISPNRGERWFSSEADARAAGWRKALNCR